VAKQLICRKYLTYVTLAYSSEMVHIGEIITVVHRSSYGCSTVGRLKQRDIFLFFSKSSRCSAKIVGEWAMG
jgi:hypothetical protein